MAFDSPIEFDIRTPLSEEQLADNVADCLKRGLPEVERVVGSGKITVLANGPSAANCPLDGDIVALNGALKLCAEKGVVPKYWAGCDPQALMADFVRDGPDETVYLVCSKCHPDVFDALSGKKVLVWHLDDYGPWALVKDRDPVSLGVSITIVVFELMKRLGYSEFETWGWDGCYRDGRSHAVSQKHGGSNIRMEVGEAVFDTTTTWALEAQDALNKFRIMSTDVTICGGGMIGEILKFHGVDGVKVED